MKKCPTEEVVCPYCLARVGTICKSKITGETLRTKWGYHIERRALMEETHD